ncbi:fimbrial outer membrane usher protein [Escherichia coli]|uniref:Fimbrial outer membrane usher protein n=1 Tax=Escherichia coli TaxID=562 RepID=A0A485JB80_ECOLX|nr:fimbrial outer membrane usher protein [Escherichia coli]
MFTIVINQFHLVRRVSVPTEGTTQITGIVGDSGQVYLSGLPLQGIINIQWGESSYQPMSGKTINYRKVSWIMPLAMQIWSAANEYITKIYSINV